MNVMSSAKRCAAITDTRADNCVNSSNRVLNLLQALMWLKGPVRRSM